MAAGFWFLLCLTFSLSPSCTQVWMLVCPSVLWSVGNLSTSYDNWDPVPVAPTQNVWIDYWVPWSQSQDGRKRVKRSSGDVREAEWNNAWPDLEKCPPCVTVHGLTFITPPPRPEWCLFKHRTRWHVDPYIVWAPSVSHPFTVSFSSRRPLHNSQAFSGSAGEGGHDGKGHLLTSAASVWKSE